MYVRTVLSNDSCIAHIGSRQFGQRLPAQKAKSKKQKMEKKTNNKLNN